MSDVQILPGTGRGTMRSMVEGGVLLHNHCACGTFPPPACDWSLSLQAGSI